MENNPASNFLKNSDFHAFLVGLAIASLHFLLASITSPLSEQFPPHTYNPLSVRDLIQVALIAPSIIPVGIISLLTSSVFVSEISVYASSSFFYGITSGFLITKRKALRRIGIILAGWWLLSNCVTWFLFMA